MTRKEAAELFFGHGNVCARSVEELLEIKPTPGQLADAALRAKQSGQDEDVVDDAVKILSEDPT